MIGNIMRLLFALLLLAGVAVRAADARKPWRRIPLVFEPVGGIYLGLGRLNGSPLWSHPMMAGAEIEVSRHDEAAASVSGYKYEGIPFGSRLVLWLPIPAWVLLFICWPKVHWLLRDRKGSR